MKKLTIIAEADKHELILKREFDAPRALVFRAFTEPELVSQWWGPEGMTTHIDQMDARKGGIWRYIQTDKDGSEYCFNGVYHELASPERIVYTFEYEGTAGHVFLETIRLEEVNGKTFMTDSSVFQSVADRDGMIAAGMEFGAEESMNRLEKLLKTL